MVRRTLARNGADKIQLGVAGMTGNRENRGKRSLQTFIGTAVRLDVGLQKGAEGIQLRCEQKRHLKNACPFGKTFPDAFFLGE